MSAVVSAVEAAVVRIGVPGEGEDAKRDPRVPEFWGSGFFVAPGWVLTNAHVVGYGRGAVWRGERVIGVTAATGRRFTGELACALPAPADPERPPSPWGDPDLALVRVPEAVGELEPDCLWLSDRSALTAQEVGLYGYITVPDSGQQLVHAEGAASGGSTGPLMIRGRLLPGASGGPVVDHRHGSVIGVNKGRDRGNPEAARATPVTGLRAFREGGPAAARVWREVLRAHDRHHLRRYEGGGPSWAREQLALEWEASGRRFPADQRVQLYAHFALLPPPRTPGQVLELVRYARGRVLRDSYRLDTHAPCSWREGVGLLYAPRERYAPDPDEGRDLEREAVLLYAARVYAGFARAAGAPVPGQRAAPRPYAPAGPSEGGGAGWGGAGWGGAGWGGGDGLAEPLDRGALDALGTWLRAAAVQLRNPVLREEVAALLTGAAGATAPATTVPTAVRPPAAAEDAAAQPAGHGGAYADVLVRIGPDFWGTHTWRVELLAGDGTVTTVDGDDTGVPRGELETRVRAALADALERGDAGDRLAAVDFMLPRELFDEPVETWQPREAVPGEPFDPHTLPLGRRRTVVLRDLHRWSRPVIPEWRRRWAGVTTGPLVAVPLCREVPASGHAHPGAEDEMTAYGRLHEGPANAVPVHCSRAARGRGARALGVALGAGHPVVLWRRCDERHSDCAEFYERAARLLAEAGVTAGAEAGVPAAGAAHAADPDGRTAPDGTGWRPAEPGGPGSAGDPWWCAPARAGGYPAPAGAPAAPERATLPELVRKLRNRNAGSAADDPEAAWARHLVLLYDPPHGPQLPDGPLRAPPLRR